MMLLSSVALLLVAATAPVKAGKQERKQ
uniref:Uncharacterized protein n=1 Tax=Rhizophora mucronata TaxID=61149 RepID=A0A2P2NHM9_RHIMU